MKIPGIPFVQAKGNYVDKDGRHYGFAWHATANTASDTAEAAYASHRTDGVSAHFYVDRDSVTQALDTDRRAGHAGSAYGNDNSIAFELTGENGWTRQQWLDNIAWAKLGDVVAYIVRNDPDYAGWQNRRAGVAEMKSNPRVKASYGHNDMRLAWAGTTHTDPGPNFPWDRLIGAIGAALGNPDSGAAAPPALTGDDMDFNQDAKLTALFDAKDTVSLDTDGTVDGKGARAAFPVPLVALIKANHEKVLDAIAARSGVPAEGEILEGGPIELSDAEVDRIAGRLAEKLGALRFEATDPSTP